MNAADRTATGYLTLRLQADELRRPLYESYQLLLTDYAGQTNRRPVRHRIEVIRDLAPEVYIVKPEADEVRVRVDGRLEIHVRAVDPDFGLRRVWLRAERGKERLAIPAGLDRRPPEKVLQAPFNMSYWFVPAEFGLKPGDRVTYWAEAEDNREPEANRAETKRRRIVIVGPGDGPPPEPEPSGPVGPPIDEPPGPHGPEPPIDEPPGPPGLPRPIIEESPGPTGPPRPPRPPGPIVEEPPGPLIDEPRHPPGPSGPHGTKDPIGGGPGGPPPPPSPPAAPVPPSADDPNLDYARQQTDLTLERLKDQLAKEKRPPVELKGWVSEEARRFLELWQQWNREARRAGPEGKAARARLREEIQRLDLRVKETTRMHSRAERGPDGSQYLRDSGQFEPPGEWAEQFREYSRGVAAGEAR
jgi:hypothetical protein